MTLPVLQALRYRSTQAVLLVLLAAAAIAASAVGPFYSRAVEQGGLQSLLRSAPVASTGLTILAPDRAEALSYAPRGTLADRFGPAVASQTIQTKYPSLHDPRYSGYVGTLLARSDICAHVQIVRGACHIAADQAVMADTTLRALQLKIGDNLPVTVIAAPGDAQTRVVISGTYRIGDPGDPYWFQQRYQTPTGLVQVPNGDAPVKIRLDPLLVGDAEVDTLHLLYAARGQSARFLTSVQLALKPRSVKPEDTAALQHLLGATRARMVKAHPAGSDDTAVLRTSLGRLLALADKGRSETRFIIPTIITQLGIVIVALLAAVIAVGIDQRRRELALARLRGRTRSGAARFVATESALLVLVGLLPGLALAWLVTRVLIATTLHVDGVSPEWQWPVFATALAVAVVGMIIVYTITRRTAAQPIQDLLRSVAPRSSRRGVNVVEAVVFVLAAGGVTVVLRTAPHSALALLVPGLLGLAVGLVLSRLIGMLAAAVGRRALWRRRTGRAVLALNAARNPTLRRLVTLVCVAAALVVSALDLWSVARTDRQARAEVEIGAPVVLTLLNIEGATLVSTVNEFDPTGRYAVPALVHTPPNGGRPLLAIDRRGLAATATWGSRANRPGLAEVDRLAPAHPPTPVDARGTQLRLRTTNVAVDSPPGVDPPAKPVSLRLSFRTANGHFTLPTVIPLPTSAEPATETGRVLGCDQGCTLSRLEVVRAVADFSPAHIEVGLDSISVDGHPLALGDEGDWQNLASAKAANGQSAPIALRRRNGHLAVVTDNDGSTSAVLQHLDVPVTPPCLVAGPLAESEVAKNGLATAGLDDEPITCEPAGRLPFAPGVGPRAVVVDAGIATTLSSGSADTTVPMVYLSKDDPVREKALLRTLEAAGGLVQSRATSSGRRGGFDRSPPSWSIQIALIAAAVAALVAGLMMIIVAFASRRTRAGDLAALRLNGVPGKTVRRAVLAEQALTVVLGVLAGAAVGVIGARIALPALPLFVQPGPVPVPGKQPVWSQVVLGSGIATAGLLITAVLAAWITFRRLDTGRAGGAVL